MFNGHVSIPNVFSNGIPLYPGIVTAWSRTKVIALLLALFMPDIWVLAGVNDTLFIDIAWNLKSTPFATV